MLIRGGSYARYAATGHLLYLSAGRVHAVGFDTQSLELRGQARDVVDEPVAEFDISVGPQGTQVLVFDGVVQVCNRASGASTVVDRYCGSVLARPDGTLLGSKLHKTAGSSDPGLYTLQDGSVQVGNSIPYDPKAEAEARGKATNKDNFAG